MSETAQTAPDFLKHLVKCLKKKKNPEAHTRGVPIQSVFTMLFM